MAAGGILQSISDNLPEVLLVVSGVMAVLIALTYVQRKESVLYKFLMVVGVVLGAVMIYESLTVGGEWHEFTRIVIAIAGFALVIRPFRNVDFAIILAIIAMAIAYIYLGSLTGDLEGLSHGTVRIVVAIVAGAFVYMVFNYIQKIAMMVGKILNWWPFLFVMGLICVVEGTLMLTGNGSILDLYHKYAGGAEEIVSSLSLLG